MLFGLPFFTFRLTVITLLILAQLYLFLRARHAILHSRLTGRTQSLATIGCGATLSLLFLANLAILLRPLPWVDPPTAAQLLLFYPPTVWTLGSLFSALFLLFAQGAGFLLRGTQRLVRLLMQRGKTDSVDRDRRRFLRAGAGALFAAPLAVSGYGASYLARGAEIRELTLPFGCPLRVVQLTDIHCGLFMNHGQLRRIVDRVIAIRPDLFVLTGDYVSNSLTFLPRCLEELARVQARCGTFATLGNHEHWYGTRDELEAIFRSAGIPLLNNDHRAIEGTGGRCVLVGIDDLRAGQADLKAALHGLDPAIPRLLLSHRPEIFPLAARLGVSLTLAGHYHGGQIRLGPSGTRTSLAHLRTPYVEGLFRIGSARLYVSRGVGTTFTPIRLNAPAEITVFNLT
jgi:hypothetical protein